MKEIKKAKMSQIVGGTTTTEMIEVGVIVENEYPEGQVGKGIKNCYSSIFFNSFLLLLPLSQSTSYILL